MDRKIKFIIFSKDRAAQLDRLLRSIDKYYPECNYDVIYKASTEVYDHGYTLIDHLLRKETTLKVDVIDLMTEEFTCFLVDDMQFINPFTPDEVFDRFAENERVACLSLRLYPGITYSYTKDENITPPPETTWPWPHFASYWGYPMSLDGHIFRTMDIEPIIHSYRFNNPNCLEEELARNPLNRDLMMCYNEAKVVNIPLNLAQSTHENRNMGIDAKDINWKFLDGQRLRLVDLRGHNSCHMAIKPEYDGR